MANNFDPNAPIQHVDFPEMWGSTFETTTVEQLAEKARLEAQANEQAPILKGGR